MLKLTTTAIDDDTYKLSGHQNLGFMSFAKIVEAKPCACAKYII